MPSVAPISAPDFVREVREDFNSPTTSNFVNRIPQCKETVAKLEEVRHLDASKVEFAPLHLLLYLSFIVSFGTS